MAAFVQLNNEWLNLDRVDQVHLDPDTGNVTVDWADHTASTYHGENARLLLEALKRWNPFAGLTGKLHEPQEAIGKMAPGSVGSVLERCWAEIPHGGMESVNIGTVSEYPRSGIEVVEAGVDPNHQTEQCDRCGKTLTQDDETVPTCDQYRYLTLCRGCYGKAGNRVR